MAHWTDRQKSHRTGARGKWTTQALLSGPLDSGEPLPREASTSNCDVGEGDEPRGQHRGAAAPPPTGGGGPGDGIDRTGLLGPCRLGSGVDGHWGLGPRGRSSEGRASGGSGGHGGVHGVWGGVGCPLGAQEALSWGRFMPGAVGPKEAARRGGGLRLHPSNGTSLQSDHNHHRCGQGLQTPKCDELRGVLRPCPQSAFSEEQKSGR